MNHFHPTWRILATAFVGSVLAASSAQAQVPGSPGSASSVPGGSAATPGGASSSVPGGSSSLPNGSQYPYWSSAPSSYSPSRVTVPVPGASPNVSNAARSPSSGASMGNIGGGYTLPYLTSRDIALPNRGGTDNKAHIWVRVPENAEVWVNGVKTKQSGEARYFYSPPLEPGKKYSYQMRVLWNKDGKPVEETQRLSVQAGATIRRDFTK